ncbi:MAG: hypothetical protein ACREQH_03835 [Candidatus Binatus sp.]
MDREKRNGILYVLSLVSIWFIFGFGYLTVWHFLNINLEGVVISSEDVPYRGAPRYVTEYLIRGPNGEKFPYVAGPSDSTLPRSMAVGTHIKKTRWSLYYQLNGVWHSFPFVFYSIVLTGALVILLYSGYIALFDN